VKAPRGEESFRILAEIERRYRLPRGYLKAKLPHPGRATCGRPIAGISAAERRRLAWHLPDDFSSRPLREQEEILAWVRTVIVSGSTEYRRYQAAASRTRFCLRFRTEVQATDNRTGEDLNVDEADLALTGPTVPPPALQAEMSALLQFKTASLTALGYQRSGVWGGETAAQKVEHLGLMFGALSASPRGPVRGHGVPLRDICFGLLVFPAVWDWYLRWREQRRGFFTAWETDMLGVAQSLTRRDTGWIRQTPNLADRLSVVQGLVSSADITCQRPPATSWSPALSTCRTR
jgi:hypothetical protein